MKKILNIIAIALLPVLLAGCSEKGSGTGIVDTINENTVTIQFDDKEYTWENKDGTLTYGECNIEYTYKEGESYYKKLKAVTQDEIQKRTKGEVKEVNFFSSLPETVEVDTVISPDDFYAVVSYWGETNTTQEKVELWDLDHKPVEKARLSESSSTYTIGISWGEYSGNVKVNTGIKYEPGSLSRGGCIDFPGEYRYDDSYTCKVTQVFSNGDFVVNNSVYCINNTSDKVYEGSRVKAKFHIIGTEWMTTVIGTEKEFGVVEIMEFID